MPGRRVIVIGAGPAGAALSLLLAQRGIDVVLVEREPTLDRVFRGEALMPSGLDALRQIGVDVDRLPSMTVPCMELFVDDVRVVRADWPELSGANAARAVSQPALLGLLVERAGVAGRFELRTATTLHAVRMSPTHVDVTLRSASGDVTMRADVVVGADGRGSTTRAAAGIKLQRLDGFADDVAWFSLPAPDTQRTDPRFQAFTTRRGSAILYPSWDGRIRVGLPLLRADRDRSTSVLLERLGAIAGEPYASIAAARAAAIPDPVFFKVLVGRVPRWFEGRLMLIGDAAHPMAPPRAQGINLALRDAIVAANHLVPALENGSGDALAAAGAGIQRERDSEIATIQQMQIAATQLPRLFRSPALRATLLPFLRRSGMVKRMMLKSETLFRHGTTRVQLAV